MVEVTEMIENAITKNKSISVLFCPTLLTVVTRIAHYAEQTAKDQFKSSMKYKKNHSSVPFASQISNKIPQRICVRWIAAIYSTKIACQLPRMVHIWHAMDSKCVQYAAFNQHVWFPFSDNN